MLYLRWEPFLLGFPAAAKNYAYMQGGDLSPQRASWLGKGNHTLKAGILWWPPIADTGFEVNTPLEKACFFMIV